MSQVDILMATYNGSNFITSQIYSILSQTFTDWNLIIHDDGSDDKTIEKIQSFCKMDSRINLVVDEYKFRDPGNHFLYLLQYSTAPFICFCDQDDVWLENKLEVMHAAIVSKEQTKEQVIFSDAYLYNSNNIWGRLLTSRPKNLKELLFINGGIHGSACIFNRKMKTTLTSVQIEHVQMHDHLLTLVGCSFGSIDYLNNKLFLYRQHSKNVTGNIECNMIKRFIRAFNYRSPKYVLDKKVINSITEFKQKFAYRISAYDSRVFEKYIYITQMSNPILRFYLIFKEGFSLGNSKSHLWIKVLTRRFVKL